MRVKEVSQRVYLMMYKNQVEVSKAVIRFQEHYESPEFRGKIFTLQEHMKWYTNDWEKAYTYYTDWNGFNWPSYVMEPFFKGKFNPLSRSEQEIVDYFTPLKGEKFYVIALHEELEDKLLEYARHELAHALFYLDSSYKEYVVNQVAKYDNAPLIKHLLDMGYNEEVITDEVHAYSMDYDEERQEMISPFLANKLRVNFNRYVKKKKS